MMVDDRIKSLDKIFNKITESRQIHECVLLVENTNCRGS